MRTVAAWEMQAAALELEGQAATAAPASQGEHGEQGETPAVATTKVPLDISKLLSDDEIRGVTGYVGKFDDAKLTDLPTTEFYDSRHFKAAGKTESYDVGLRVWRLGTAAAEVQYRKLLSTLPGAKSTDEVGDASFRAKSGTIAGLVYLVRERGVVISMTCGAAQCTEPGQLVKLAKLVESKLPELPPEAAERGATSAAGDRPMTMTRVAFLTAVVVLARAPARARLRSRDDARRADGARGARVRAAPRARRARCRARWGCSSRSGCRSTRCRPSRRRRSRRGWRRWIRRRAGAPAPTAWRPRWPGHRRVRHRHDAGGARPGLLLRPEPRQRAVAGGRARVAGEHAGSACSIRAACARCSPARHFNMTGRPSTEWLRAPENDVGLAAFHAALEAAIAGEPTAAPRARRSRARCWRWAAC